MRKSAPWYIAAIREVHLYFDGGKLQLGNSWSARKLKEIQEVHESGKFALSG
jgi:hypothetical protein